MSAPPPPWPLGVMLTNDDGPPGKYAPFLLPFSRVLKHRLAALHSSHPASSSTPTPPPSSLFVCTPSDQQSWVGKAISRLSQVRSHTNWPTSHIPAPPSSASPLPTPLPPPAAALVTSPSPDVALWSTVEGTPSTTANVGLHVLAPFPIDLVLSGPNLGRNTGRSFLLSSGTVGAALEGAFGGRRAVALSFAFFDRLQSYTAQHVDDACEAAVDVVLSLWQDWGPGVELYNVNVPLGCSRHPRVLHTHVLLDSYGAIYLPQSYRRLGGEEAGEADVDERAKEAVDSPLPPPASPTLPPHRPTLPGAAAGATGSVVAVEGTEVEALSHVVEYRFNVAMFNADWTALPTYEGSDYWAVKSGVVSVTPLIGSLVEAEWSSARYSRARAEEEGRGDRKCAL